MLFIRRVVLIAVLVLQWHTAAYGDTNNTIIVLGDSLSSGYGLGREPSWVTLLSNRLESEGYGFEVVNASIAGDTSAGALSRLPRLLETHVPGIVLIEIGGNDGLRGQPVANLRGNLTRMIELSMMAGAKVVLAGIQIPPNYGTAYTDALASVYPELADAFNIPLVGFFMDGVALTEQYMQRDRIHPNAEGQRILVENVWPILEPLFD